MQRFFSGVVHIVAQFTLGGYVTCRTTFAAGLNSEVEKAARGSLQQRALLALFSGTELQSHAAVLLMASLPDSELLSVATHGESAGL